MKSGKHLFISVKGNIDDEDFMFIVKAVKTKSTLRSNSYIFPKETIAYSDYEKCAEYSQENHVTANYWDIVFDMDVVFEVFEYENERILKC